MTLHRRTLLASGCAALATLSGCSIRSDSGDPSVDLSLFNYTAERQPLQVEVLRADGDGYDDARVLDREFEIPPPTGDESVGVVREPDVVRRRRSVVRVLLRKGRGRWRHHHFYPGETTGADRERIDVRIYRDEGPGTLYARFR